MNTEGISVECDFRDRALANDLPVARLVGFNAKDIAQGLATVFLAAGPEHANPMGTLHGGILCDIADAAMGMAFASTLAPVYYRRTQDQLLSPGLACTTQSGGSGGAAGPHRRVRGMQHFR